MTDNYLIGLDAGGGSGRCLLVNTSTGGFTSVCRPWSLQRAPEAGNFAYKLDPINTWRILGEIVQEAISKVGISPHQVAGIAATSIRHSTIVIDKKGQVLMAAPNRDARAAEQGIRLAADYSKEFYQITGHAPNPIFTAARLVWMKETQPESFRSAFAALSLSDWIGYLLTGEIASESSQAGESLLLDLHSRKWSSEVLGNLGLSAKILPPLKPAGAKLGKLTREAATNLGLVPGIPVAVGGPDTQCGLLGAGVVSPGQIGVIAGTTTPIQMVVGEPVIDPEMRIWTGLHIIPGRYILESNAGQMGLTLNWFARLLHPTAINAEAILDAEATSSAPGAYGIYSNVGAAIFNASAMQLPVDNLTFSSVVVRHGEEGHSDVARAILEGMAYAVRANIEQIMRVAGTSQVELWIGGGISRSKIWTRLLSDVTGYNVHVSAACETSALGAAICAGVAAGHYPNLEAGAKHLAQYSHHHQPGEEYQTYQSLYADWQTLRQERYSADMAASSQFTSVMMADTPQATGGSPLEHAFRPKIYISAEVDEAALRQLREIGEVTYKPYRSEGILLTGDDLVQTLKTYQVFVTEVDIVDADALLKLPDLRLIIVCRGNPVNIDLEACTAANIPVCNTPARNADAVADLTVLFMLMLARQMQPASNFLRQPGGEAGDLGRMGQAHEEFLGMELWRKTFGVVGGGAIGQKVIQRLLPFGVRIVLYDPYVNNEQATLMGAEKVPFERLLAESDFVSLHAPVTDGTRGMMDAGAFDRMKSGSFLVNTARAALVDPSALLAALRSGKLGGYATDVFPVEPPAVDDPLLAFPNVIATPHIGGNTREVAAHQGEIIYYALDQLLKGKKPKYLLNEETLKTFSWSGKRHTDLEKLMNRSIAPGPGATDIEVATQKEKTVESYKSASSSSQVVISSGKGEDMETNPAREKMVEILKEFTNRLLIDPELTNFAKGKNVTFLFTIKDIDQSFFMSFVDGKVSAELGQPPKEPDVKLKMSADILDGMFTGRVNATKAATSGKLSFSGDTGKAMSFIRIQGNMSRLYSEVRQQIGDPGDLTKLGVSTPVQAIGATTTPVSPRTQTSYHEEVSGKTKASTGDIRDQILLVTNELYAKGLITATGGNVSARCDDNPNEIWITPSAIFKGDLRPDMMVRIDQSGKILGDTDYTASSERRVHCAIYQSRPEITAVIHTHAPQATLMALTGTKFLPISTEVAFFGDVPVVPFIMPGTDELATQVAEAMGADRIAVLMQNHGLVVAGSSLRRASDMTDVLETSAHKILTCKMLGITPPILPDEVVKQLREIGSSIA